MGRVLGRHRHRRLGGRAAHVRPGREDRHARRHREGVQRLARRRARACSPVPPTSPATPAPSSPGRTPQSFEHPGGRQMYYGIREHAMGSAMVGMALHGGVLPAGGTFFVFLDYMRPPVRLAALSHAKVRVRVDARLGRCRRGRSDAPAGRAPRHAAGDPRAAGHPPGRRQRDGRGVEGGRRPRRPDRARAQPPGDHRVHRRLRRRAAVPPSCVSADDPQVVLVGTGSEVSLCVDAADAAGRRGHRAPAWSACRRGIASPRRPPTTRTSVLPAGVPGAVGRGRGHVRLGALRRRLDRHRPLRRQRARRRGARQARHQRRQRRGSGHATALSQKE